MIYPTVKFSPMKPLFLALLFTFTVPILATAQDETMKKDSTEPVLPYRQIPDYPDAYSAGTVAARLIDGLGFRYYWATEGLREEDLQFQPNEEARTSRETLDHIYGLSLLIARAPRGEANLQPSTEEELSFEELRRKTLENFREAGELLRASRDEEIARYNIIFQRGEEVAEFPFWNLINGPIADALWHVGQVVSFRRSSGNPLNPKVSVFSGRVRE